MPCARRSYGRAGHGDKHREIVSLPTCIRGAPRDVSPAAEIRLREARADELAALSELCLRSKAVWGYDAAFMEACRRELTLTGEELGRTLVRVAEHEGRPIGLCQIAVEGPNADLAKLFVEPAELGRGCGRVLFLWAVATARDAGARRMTIDADPGAVPFYVRMGARSAGVAPSGSIPGRVLPRLEVALCPICDISHAGAGFEGEQQDEDV